MKTKIDWSGRSHFYNKEEKKYLLKVIDKADPLTQGTQIKKFESGLRK